MIITCPTCHGSKSVIAFWAVGEIRCPTCDGTGEVERNPDWLMRGEALKEHRIAKGLGMREAAELWGFVPSEYVEAENGRRDPTEFERQLNL